MKTVFFILLFNLICITELSSCNRNGSIDVDSLFTTNLLELKKIVGNSSENVPVLNISNCDFLYVISLLANEDFINPHCVMVNSDIIMRIESWYYKNKKYITSEKVEKAYYLSFPPMYKTMEELDKYSEELDQLKITD